MLLLLTLLAAACTGCAREQTPAAQTPADVQQTPDAPTAQDDAVVVVAPQEEGPPLETPAEAETSAPAETPDAAQPDEAPDAAEMPADPDAPFQAQLPERAAVDASWFDDAVFVGDSVSLWLKQVAVSDGSLGNATFLVAGSLSARNALWEVSDESVHPSYQGVKMKIEDAVAQCGATKVYIMLGMNDIGFGIDEAVTNYTAFVQSILAKAPDVQIFIQSMTPMTSDSPSTSSTLNNDRINAFNAELLTLCQENGWYYLDIHSLFTGEDGAMLPSYCSDPDTMGMHIQPEVVPIWVDYLKTHTPQD